MPDGGLNMVKWFAVGCVCMLAILFANGCARSGEPPAGGGEHGGKAEEAPAAVQDMAPVCPIEGGKVADLETAPSAEYKGKRYFFCCTSCKTEFERDPETYVASFEQKVAAAEKEVERHEAASSGESSQSGD